MYLDYAIERSCFWSRIQNCFGWLGYVFEKIEIKGHASVEKTLRYHVKQANLKHAIERSYFWSRIPTAMIGKVFENIE